MIHKKALVTGAGRGIGRAIAVALADQGWDVGVNYHQSEEPAREVCRVIESKGRKALALRGDVGKIEDISEMFAKFLGHFGGIDLLVNNAGITKFKPILETTPELWDEITNTDWKGSYFCTQYAAKDMVENGTKGVIINITSVHQTLNFPMAGVYGPTKAALFKFTRHAALEFAPYGIRVNSIAPGYIKVTDPAVVTDRERMMVSRIPAQRIGRTQEIAEAVCFLASEKAEYVTGANLTVDGGALLPALMDNTYCNLASGK
jgi:NAD(P)-dependent dehydrogenase (short-subunit alcohol dehydrogenase family)